MISNKCINVNAASRLAVITGANKGIGYFIALQLGLSGLFSHVLIGCRSPQLAADAVASLKAQLPDSVSVHSEELRVGDKSSHQHFANMIAENFGKIDVLVNNAGIAFKNADPTPFKEQCKPTLDVNFRGTVDLTEELLPLIRKGLDPRIVNVASMAGRLGQVSPELQQQFASKSLTMPALRELMNSFEASVQGGRHTAQGWSNSNYGMSKLALIAATKVLARQEFGKIAINCCCPGYCKTDMTSQMGSRDPADGAKNAVIPATMENPVVGQYFADYNVASW